MRQLIHHLERRFRPGRGRFSPHAKRLAGTLAFAFATYLVLVALYGASYVPSGCGGYHDDRLEWAVFGFLALLSGLAAFPVVRLWWQRGAPKSDELGDGDRAPRRTYAGALFRGIGSSVLFGTLVLGFCMADREYRHAGPTTHHITSSGVANRVLDAWAYGTCVFAPSQRCDVLLTHRHVPLRTTLADRACRSGFDGTHSLCAISLEERSIPRDEICRRDAVAPFDERVCPDAERNRYRRGLGLIVHGERR